jgi:uncharacterized protein (DUF433 family)
MNLPESLVEAPCGDIRLTGSGVSLYHVVHYYNDGYSPERLRELFPWLRLDLIQKAIGFYLENRAAVDAFVARYEAEAERLTPDEGKGPDFKEFLRRRPDLARLTRRVAPPRLSVSLPDFLTEVPYGEIRLTGHRIGLYHVVSGYQEGYTAEMLHDQFPTLSPELIRKVLEFYEQNKGEVDAYVAVERAEIDHQCAVGPRMSWEELDRRFEAMQRTGKS